MNENLNLVEILKDCKKGTKLYSPIFGEVEFNCIYKNAIECESEDGVWYFNIDGTITIGTAKSQIISLYPSKDQQDWSKFKVKSNKPKFDPKKLNPFDRVLVRDSEDDHWYCDLFSNITNNSESYHYLCVGGVYKFCIPYNGYTKHLVGLSKEAPEFYRYWEELHAEKGLNI